MSATDKARDEGYEAGYLAAIRDLHARVRCEVLKMQNAEAEAGAFYLIFNGLRNGLEKVAADFELQAVKNLAARRAAKP